jgi:hypothetical protein
MRPTALGAMLAASVLSTSADAAQLALAWQTRCTGSAIDAARIDVLTNRFISPATACPVRHFRLERDERRVQGKGTEFTWGQQRESQLLLLVGTDGRPAGPLAGPYSPRSWDPWAEQAPSSIIVVVDEPSNRQATSELMEVRFSDLPAGAPDTGSPASVSTLSAPVSWSPEGTLCVVQDESGLRVVKRGATIETLHHEPFEHPTRVMFAGEHTIGLLTTVEESGGAKTREVVVIAGLPDQPRVAYRERISTQGSLQLWGVSPGADRVVLGALTGELYVAERDGEGAWRMSLQSIPPLSNCWASDAQARRFACQVGRKSWRLIELAEGEPRVLAQRAPAPLRAGLSSDGMVGTTFTLAAVGADGTSLAATKVELHSRRPVGGIRVLRNGDDGALWVAVWGGGVYESRDDDEGTGPEIACDAWAAILSLGE